MATLTVTLPDGSTVDVQNVPDGISSDQVSAALAKQSAAPAQSPLMQGLLSDGKVIGKGLTDGVMSGLAFPAKAVLGTAEAVLPDKVSEYLGQKVNAPLDDLEQQAKDWANTQHGVMGVQPNSTRQQYEQAIAEAAGGAAMSPTSGLAKAMLLNGGASAAGEFGAQNNLPLVTAAAPYAGGILGGIKSAALPDAAKLAVKGAITTVPGELPAALATMKNADVPLLPGQAFGPGHQMEGLQDRVVGSPVAGTAVQGQLRQQATAMSDALGPTAPFRVDYNDAGKTPITQADANSLAVALGKARVTGNPVGGDVTTTGQLANLPINIGGGSGYNPATNLGQVQSIRSAIKDADIPPTTQAAMSNVASDFLRTKDGRFASSDAKYGDLMDNQRATQLGRSAMGSAAASGGGDAGLANALIRGHSIGFDLASAPLVGKLFKGNQDKSLASIMTDTTGKSLTDAAGYSPGQNTLTDLAAALRNAQIFQGN